MNFNVVQYGEFHFILNQNQQAILRNLDANFDDNSEFDKNVKKSLTHLEAASKQPCFSSICHQVQSYINQPIETNSKETNQPLTLELLISMVTDVVENVQLQKQQKLDYFKENVINIISIIVLLVITSLRIAEIFWKYQKNQRGVDKVLHQIIFQIQGLYIPSSKQIYSSEKAGNEQPPQPLLWIKFRRPAFQKIFIFSRKIYELYVFEKNIFILRIYERFQTVLKYEFHLFILLNEGQFDEFVIKMNNEKIYKFCTQLFKIIQKQPQEEQINIKQKLKKIKRQPWPLFILKEALIIAESFVQDQENQKNSGDSTTQLTKS